MKTCSRCRQAWPSDMFARNRRQPDGLTYYCRPCIAAYRAERRQQGLCRRCPKPTANGRANCDDCLLAIKAARSPSFNTWRSMVERCTNPSRPKFKGFV